jgi:hypothetical protein
MGGGGAAGAGARGGGGASWARLETSSKRLKIQWDTYTRVLEEKLDAATALREVKGRDPRPILLLRDCDFCVGKDDALLEKSMEDEKILLASRWFHCVRVDRGVLKESHPLNSLFAGANPPHMVLFSSDGEDRSELQGRPSARVLWSSMKRALRKDYKKSADAAMAKWIALLSRFDALDSRKSDLTSQRELTSDGRKAAEIDRKLADLEREIAKAYEEEKRITDLEFRDPAVTISSAVDLDDAAVEAVTRSKAKSSLLDKIKKDQDAKDESK